MKSRHHILIAGISLILIGGYVIIRQPLAHQDIPVDHPGESLSRTYCASCHQFPSPELLDIETWKTKVLPDMGRRMGIKSVGPDHSEVIVAEDVVRLQDLGIYPNSPTISESDWKAIVDYYLVQAPKTLSGGQTSSDSAPARAPFHANLIDIEGHEIPQVTLLHYDAVRHEIYIGNNQVLYALNPQGEFSARWALSNPAVDFINFENGTKGLLTIGSVEPSDLRQGSFLLTSLQAPDSFFLVLDSLPRPVDFTVSDLDGDRVQDLLICGFGHHQGALTWYRNFSEPHVLSRLPGARKSIVQDMDQDGLMDIVVLMGQAWESIDIYYNKGAGEFSKETVLEFSPVHGVSYLQVKDFNADGFYDLLVTNGDNWDLSAIEKPYHGIRIYLNDGTNHFEEAGFYPMNGCSKAIARDFDQDGDLDIAAIAFYDHLDHPENSFLYLENRGNLQFKSHFLPEARNGKWLVMEAGDFNQDGFDDLFLGSYFHNLNEWTKLASQGTEEFPEVLYLLNATMVGGAQSLEQ